MKLTFGRNAQQERHTFRHCVGAALDTAEVLRLVSQDLESRWELLNAGLFAGQVMCAGVLLEYRALKFADGTINVGRITILP